MSFWSTKTIIDRQATDNIISPFDKNNIQQGAYELTLGEEAFTTEFSKKFAVKPGEQISIPPGQFALLITEEVVKIPADTIAFLSIKASIKLQGLVNVSGFHVDPGYEGKLKFGVFNAGNRDIVMTRGDMLFLIWFSHLDMETDDLYSKKDRKVEERNTITSNDVMRLRGEMASPAALAERVRKIENKLKTAKTVVRWSIATVITACITAYITLLVERTAPNIAPDRTPQLQQVKLPPNPVPAKK